MTRPRLRRRSTRAMLAGLAWLGTALAAIGQESPPEVGHGLTPEDAANGWISLFDGRTTFGWADAGVENGRLTGGATTSSFDGGRLRGDFERGGSIRVGGETIVAQAGVAEITFVGRAAPIVLGDGATVRSLSFLPSRSKTLFDGRSLEGCTPVNMPNAKPGRTPTWTLEDGRLHARGGPGAMELPGTYGDFVLQVEVKTRGRRSNGGVFFRNPPGTCMMGYEMQIYNRCEDDDPARPSRYATGAIDDRQNARRLFSRDGRPFVLTAVVHGAHLATWVNGAQATDWTDARERDETPRKGLRADAGTIQLQAHDPETDLDFGKVVISPIR